MKRDYPPFPKLVVSITPLPVSPTETMTLQGTIGGVYFELNNIPANRETNLRQILGPIIGTVLDSEGAASAVTQYIVDGTHFVTTKITGAAVNFQADLDGAASYAEERFFDFVSASASRIETVAKWGANGMSFVVQDALLGSTVLVGGKKDPTTGVSFFRNGPVGTSQAAFQILVDGVRYASLQDLW